MPFSERRLFFKKDRVIVRNIGRGALLIGILFIGWELGLQYSPGHERPAPAPLTAPLAQPAMDTTAASRNRRVTSDNDTQVHVRVISHTLSGYSKAPASVAKPDRVAKGAPYYAPTSRPENEPSESALTTMMRVKQSSSKAPVQPKVAEPRQVSVRSQRPRPFRSQAKRPASRSNGQPLFQDLPKWADKTLFKDAR